MKLEDWCAGKKGRFGFQPFRIYDSEKYKDLFLFKIETNMTDTKIQRFKFTIPIIKTSVKIVKDKDGNEIEERYVEGIASGTELDLHGDRMAPSAIKSMAKSLKQHVIALNAEHDTSWLGELGDIDKLEIAENNDLGIKAKLNEMSSAKDLWYALIEKNKKLGLSIGGYVKDYETVKKAREMTQNGFVVYKRLT